MNQLHIKERRELNPQHQKWEARCHHAHPIINPITLIIITFLKSEVKASVREFRYTPLLKTDIKTWFCLFIYIDLWQPADNRPVPGARSGWCEDAKHSKAFLAEDIVVFIQLWRRLSRWEVNQRDTDKVTGEAKKMKSVSKDNHLKHWFKAVRQVNWGNLIKHEALFLANGTLLWNAWNYFNSWNLIHQLTKQLNTHNLITRLADEIRVDDLGFHQHWLRYSRKKTTFWGMIGLQSGHADRGKTEKIFLILLSFQITCIKSIAHHH
jgi:hypothetical protein